MSRCTIHIKTQATLLDFKHVYAEDEDLVICDAWLFIGHRRYVKDGHWIRDAGVSIGKREHTHRKR